MELIKSVKSFLRNSPYVAKGKEILHRTTKSVLAPIMRTTTYKYFKKILTGSLPNFPPSFIPGASIPPTVWNSQVRKILKPVGGILRRPTFQIYNPPQAAIVGDLVFGVPPEYLYPTTLAGKEYIDNPEELFRFFIIKDVGQIQLPEELKGGKSFWQFEFESKWDDFAELVNFILASGQVYDRVYQLGDKKPIKFAIDNNEFQFSFSNSYTDTFLERMNNVLSQPARQIAYMYGGTLQSAIKQFGDWVKQLGNSSVLLAPLTGMWNAAEKIASSMSNANVPEGVRQFFTALNTGSRIVFPKIWQGSNFSNQFTIRTTLFALSDDQDEISKRILVPLAIILVLSTPLEPEKDGSGGYFYRFPFVIRCEIEGVREIEAAVITNLRIGLGGERSFYDVEKRYLAVDVEFEVMDVYDTMITTRTGQHPSIVPTTSKWFQYLSNFIRGTKT